MPLTWNQPLLCRRRMPSRRSPSRLRSMRRRKSSLLSALVGTADIGITSFAHHRAARPTLGNQTPLYLLAWRRSFTQVYYFAADGNGLAARPLPFLLGI